MRRRLVPTPQASARDAAADGRETASSSLSSFPSARCRIGAGFVAFAGVKEEGSQSALRDPEWYRLNPLAGYLGLSCSPTNPSSSISILVQWKLDLLIGLARETASRTVTQIGSLGNVEELDPGLRLANLHPLIKRVLLPAHSKRGWPG